MIGNEHWLTVGKLVAAQGLRGEIRIQPYLCSKTLRLAALQPGDIVLDPMAGTGSIPVSS